MDNREVALHLLSEIERLNERVLHMEKGLEIGIYDRMKHAVTGGGKALGQFGLLQLLLHFDPDAHATSPTTLEFKLKAKVYSVTLNEGKTVVNVQCSTDGQHSSFGSLDDLKGWINAQKGVLATAAPEGSRLLQYTNAVLAQQGARKTH
jgi:hypothetical protein